MRAPGHDAAERAARLHHQRMREASLVLQDQLAAEGASEDVLFEAVEDGEDASGVYLRSLLLINVVVGDDQVLTRPKLKRGALKTLTVTH